MIESSNSLPLISIIMSVKDGSKTLQKSVSSILDQYFKNWEFIICDDGSTDDTLQILNDFAVEDDRFVILHNEENKGLAYSLNACIVVSKSNILARQDADDTSAPDRLGKQYDFVLAHPEYAIVGTNNYNVNEEGKIIGKSVRLEKPTALQQIKGGIYMHPSWMMRKDQLEKVGFYTVNKYTMRSQDYHLVMKVLGAGMQIYNMPEFLYYYTTDESTIKRSHNWKRMKGLMWIRWNAYKKNHLPWWCYIYVAKPLVVHLIPQRIMKKHYKKVYGNK